MFKSLGRLALILLVSINSFTPASLFGMQGKGKGKGKEEQQAKAKTAPLRAQCEAGPSSGELLEDDGLSSSDEASNVEISEQTPIRKRLEIERKSAHTTNNDEPAKESSFLFQHVTLTKPQSNAIWNNMPKDLQELTTDLADKSYEGSLPNLIVLYGPNGTGKSKTAAVIAKKSKRKLIFINAGFVGSMWKNSEKFNLGEAVAKVAKMNIPAVIVVDEADVLTFMHSNDEANDQSLDKTIGELMDSCEENPHIFFIFTTNNPGRLGSKLIDLISGNFYELGLPSAQARKQILSSYIDSFGDMGRDPSLDLDKIAGTISAYKCIIGKTEDFCTRKLWWAMTHGFSIRKLRDLVKEARRKAKKRPGKIILQQADFEQAYQEIKARIDRSYESSRWERCYRHVKNNAALYGIGTTVVLAAAGGTLHYKQTERLAREAREQADRIAAAQSHLTKCVAAIGAAAAVVGALIVRAGQAALEKAIEVAIEKARGR